MILFSRTLTGVYNIVNLTTEAHSCRMSTAVMSMFSCGHFSRYPSRGIPPALQIASLFLVPLQQLLSANSAQRATSTFLPFFVARLARLGTACSTWTWGQRHKALLSSELWSGELWAVTVSELNFITTGILIHYIKAIEYKWGTFRNYVDVGSESPVWWSITVINCFS